MLFLLIVIAYAQTGILITGSNKILLTENAGREWEVINVEKVPTTACYTDTMIVLFGFKNEVMILTSPPYQTTNWTTISLPYDVYYSCAILSEEKSFSNKGSSYFIVASGTNGGIISGRSNSSNNMIWDISHYASVPRPTYRFTVHSESSGFVCGGSFMDPNQGPQYLLSTSSDNGHSWIDIKPPDVNSFQISSGASCGDVVIAWNTDGTYFRQVKGGKFILYDNVMKLIAYTLVGCINNTTIVVSACDGSTQFGTFVSTNAGENFTFYDQTMPCFASFYTPPPPTKNNVIFATTKCVSDSDCNPQIYMSHDGISWSMSKRLMQK